MEMTSRSAFSCSLLHRALLRDAIELLNITIEAEPDSPAFWMPDRLEGEVASSIEAKNPTGCGLDVKKWDDAKRSNGILREIFGDTVADLKHTTGFA